MITPLDLDESNAYPLVLIVYEIFYCVFIFSNVKQIVLVNQVCFFPPDFNSDSAPGGQAVSDQFSLGWDSVLVSLHGVIVARLDGRGSGFQGQKILHAVHQRVGTVDVQDQLSALQ